MTKAQGAVKGLLLKSDCDSTDDVMSVECVYHKLIYHDVVRIRRGDVTGNNQY